MDPTSFVSCTSLVCATFLLAPLSAQRPGHHGPSDQGHSHGLHFAHPLFTESISPDRKIRLDYASAWQADAREHEVEWEGEWAFHRSFSIEVKLPYVFVDPDAGASRSAVGTVEAALKFANFGFEHYGLLLGYGIGFGLPTGDPAAGIGSDHVWEIEPLLNVGWKRDRVELVGWARFGIPANQAAGEDVETEFHYDLSGLWHVSSRVQALLELNGETGLSGPEAGAGVVSVSPGVKVAPLARRPLFVGVAASVPLGEQDLDARLRVSLLYHF